MNKYMMEKSRKHWTLFTKKKEKKKERKKMEKKEERKKHKKI